MLTENLYSPLLRDICSDPCAGVLNHFPTPDPDKTSDNFTAGPNSNYSSGFDMWESHVAKDNLHKVSLGVDHQATTQPLAVLEQIRSKKATGHRAPERKLTPPWIQDFDQMTPCAYTVSYSSSPLCHNGVSFFLAQGWPIL